MNTNSLIRWGGLAALLSGILSIAIEIARTVTIGRQAYSTAALTIEWSILYAIRLVAIMLLMLGLIALFARQSRGMGVFGLAAFFIAAIGTMLILGFAWMLLFIFPVMAEAVPVFLDALASEPGVGVILTLFLVTIGWLLFGIASLRAKVLPSGSAWFIIVGAILAFVLNTMAAPLSWVVFDLGVIWMGWWLWTEKIIEQRVAPILTT